MQRVTAALKTQAFIWDFSKDGGVIGVYNTPIKIPRFSIAWSCHSTFIAAYTGGGSTVNIGWTGQLSMLNSFGPSVIGSVVSSYGQTQNVGFLLTAPETTITFEISAAAMTAGVILTVINYFEAARR